MNIKSIILTPEYEFLTTNAYLKNNIILLALGGSYAYGTNTESSDIDVRGIAVNSPKFILTGRDFEQVIDNRTDTVIYSLDKIMTLLSDMNPNIIEILGVKPEHRLNNSIGEMLINNRQLFLSQKAYYTFGAYAKDQLRRLENKSIREVEQARQEEHLLNTINSAMEHFTELYPNVANKLQLYLSESKTEDLDKELFMNIILDGVSVREFSNMQNELNTIIRDYDKLGKRNKNALTHNKITKHMMHLVRLYYMCFDILEKEEVVTYRDAEHNLLMSIRNGVFLNADDTPTDDFYALLSELNTRLDYGKKNTALPLKADRTKINDLHYEINKTVLG